MFYVLSGLCFGIATILRPSSVIILVALILFLIWKLLLEKFKNWKKIIVTLIVICVVSIGTIKLFDLAMVKFEFVPNSAVTQNLKYFKFVTGIYGKTIYGFKSTSAEKTQYYYDLEYLGFNYDQYNEICKNTLIDSLKNDTQERIRFISDKMTTYCGANDNQIQYAYDNIKDDNLCNIFQYYGYVQYVLLLLLSLICSFIYLKKRKELKYAQKDEHLDIIFKAAFIGYFLVHLFIEAQPRYRYEQYFMLVIISAPCLSIIFDKIEKIWLKVKNKKIYLDEVITEEDEK